MDFSELFDFLTQLQENNSKEWMDANRKWYRNLRSDFIYWLDGLDFTMAQLDDHYCPTPGNKGINRINNNLMFHPNKPIYKDHFAAALDKVPNTADSSAASHPSPSTTFQALACMAALMVSAVAPSAALAVT